MWHTSVPGRVLPVKELHTPGLCTSAQPAVFRCAFAINVGISDAKFPVRLPGHIDLPVVATKAEGLQTDDIEGGVEASWEVRKLLPGVRVGGAVTFGRDDQLWVCRFWIQVHITGIWKQIIEHFSSEDFT